MMHGVRCWNYDTILFYIRRHDQRKESLAASNALIHKKIFFFLNRFIFDTNLIKYGWYET